MESAQLVHLIVKRILCESELIYQLHVLPFYYIRM
jgi:hypothetical protein